MSFFIGYTLLDHKMIKMYEQFRLHFALYIVATGEAARWKIGQS